MCRKPLAGFWMDPIAYRRHQSRGDRTSELEKNFAAMPSGLDQTGRSQVTEVSGDGGLWPTELADEFLLSRLPAIEEATDDGEPGRVGQHLENAGGPSQVLLVGVHDCFTSLIIHLSG
jgi:hypothetical protein